MPVVNLDNIKMFYQISGEGEPLILLAGFGVDHRVWQTIVAGLADQFKVIVLDNRGIGQSSTPDYPYTIDMMADDVVQFCQALNIKQAHFLGGSMGGAIVQTLGYRYPELCRSLIIYNSFAEISERYSWFAKAKLKAMQLNLPTRVLAELSVGWVFSNSFLAQTELIDGLLDMAAINPYLQTEIGYRCQLNALLNFNSNSWLAKIKVPTLIIGSDQDLIVPVEDFHYLAATIPEAEYYQFNGAGHTPHLEEPERFKEVVLNFCQHYTDGGK
jgi:3-oxoadipate enol-lactonase